MTEARALQVQFSIDDAARGTAIADALLGDHLVSCVQQLGPMISQYHWEGAIERTQEWLFLAKTTSDRIEQVVAAIAAAHPYEVPEVIVTEIVGGLSEYLDWNESESSG